MLKHKLPFYHRFTSENNQLKDIEFGASTSIDLKYITCCHKYIKNKITDIVVEIDDFVAVSWLKVCGVHFNNNLIVSIAVDNFIPVFGFILSVVVVSIRNIFFLVSVLNTLEHDEHYQSYYLITSNEVKCINHEHLITYHLSNLITLSNGKRYTHLQMY